MEKRLSKNQLRCFCSRQPLLCVYGLDKDRKPYIHIRVYKQGRTFGDVMIRGGEVELLCRECLRWHKIVFRVDKREAELVETEQPPEVDRSKELSETVA